MDEITRRQLIQGIVATLAPAVLSTEAPAGEPTAALNKTGAYEPALLPRGIRSRFVANVNGLRMHVLEAGFETPNRPAVLLLHGFPELAYSWRHVMVPLASAGFHVIAPDRRGYGRTTGLAVGFDDDIAPFGAHNQVRDALGLVAAFGYRSVAAVIGHDQGSPIAGWCALARPDVFRSVVMMSSPFGGPPALPFKTADVAPSAPVTMGPADRIDEELAALTPPRKHYQRYYSTREANENLWHPPQGVHAFLRAYYHMKSADWKQNAPTPLAARTAREWAKLPRYYIMDLDRGMAQTVAPEMPSPAEIAACKWLPDEALKVYSAEYARTGFQGGLQGYRVAFEAALNAELTLFSGRTIDQPSLFIGGRSDWGVYQNPGAIERLQQTLCPRPLGLHLVDGAGHWVQQEQPAEVSRLLVQFLREAASR